MTDTPNVNGNEKPSADATKTTATFATRAYWLQGKRFNIETGNDKKWSSADLRYRFKFFWAGGETGRVKDYFGE